MTLLDEVRAALGDGWEIKETPGGAFRVSLPDEHLCLLCKNPEGKWGWTINMIPPDSSPIFEHASPATAFEHYKLFRSSRARIRS